MKYLVSLAFIFFLYPVGLSEVCEKIRAPSGRLSDSITRDSDVTTKCWIIEVPQDSYLKLDVDINFYDLQCAQAYLKLNVLGKNLTYYELEYCSEHENMISVISFGDVTITYYTSEYYYEGGLRYDLRNGYYETSFEIAYSIESLCAQPFNFRCSPNVCIHRYKLCNGVKDCENGADEIPCGIAGVEGMDESRKSAMAWLQKQRSISFAWGKDTHRAITALFLAKTDTSTGENLEKELKQLELQISLALLRNSTDPISLSELGMFVNALRVICLNPRNFYGHDLLQILGERASVSNLPNPSTYLSLCNSKWKFNESDVERIVKSLQPLSKYPISLGVQALAFMAISCVKKEDPHLISSDRISLYEDMKKKFIAAQHSDGSFGNVYTTALVTQALISSGQNSSGNWNVTATAHYLMKQLSSPSIDFLSTYLTLPVLTGRSLVDISSVNCSNTENDISDVTNKLGDKMSVQYSLYVGDQKDVIHTIFLRLPENSTAYDIMRLAQVECPKYKFRHQDIFGKMHVYDIAGITNDPEAGKFWLLFMEDRDENRTLKLLSESPDELALGDEDHLIMWYRTPDI